MSWDGEGGRTSGARPATLAPPGAVRFLYNALLALLLPLLILYYAYRVTLGGKSGRGFLERLGFLPRAVLSALERTGDEPLIWVHAVSVGEVAAAQPIIREIRRLLPRAKVALSMTTATGRQLAEERMTECHALFYLPLDLPMCVRATLDAVRPDALVLMETELWPNLIDQARARGIPTLVANGRISDRSYARALRVRPLYAWVLSCLDWFCVQTQADADRAATLGASPERVVVLGNSKFDETVPEMPGAQRRALRDEYGLAPDAPVLVYGSTGAGEDALLLDAYQAMRLGLPGLRLIHVPRHPERGPEVRSLAEDRGFEAVPRSRMRDGEESPVGRDCIVILDTIGELLPLYAIADVVFVGRSLVPQAGGNILQPLSYGKPVLVGPHTENFREIVRICTEAGICSVVSSPEELAERTVALLEHHAERVGIAERAERLLGENRGASRRYAEAVASALRGEPVSRG